MLFNSFEFLVFFVVVYALYIVLNHKFQNYLLLSSSLFFYAFWDWRLLFLLLASIILNFLFGLKIHDENKRNQGRFFLILSICVNLGLLGFFKYFNFFAHSLQGLAATVGWHLDEVTLQIVLPLGISFYTFQKMSYTIDIYRRRLEPSRSLLDFSLFACYFPQLIAGPIERPGHLFPQFRNRRTIRPENVWEGLYLIGFGLFKKVFIADNLAKVVDEVFLKTGVFSGGVALMGTYAFAFQIYGDFSGYSDMARGLSKLMGIDLMVNFKFPYFVSNPRDFWKNWHISLSTWLRDYLYIPLGGNRGGRLMQFRNLFLTMLLGGFWHGAAWTYVLWGAYHGVLLIVHRLAEPLLKRIRFKDGSFGFFWRAITVFWMFHLTCLGWLIFRSQSVDQFVTLASNIFFNFSLTSDIVRHYFLHIVFFIWFLLIVELLQKSKDNLMIFFVWPLPVRVVVSLTLFYMTLLWGEFGQKQFIYFQF